MIAATVVPKTRPLYVAPRYDGVLTLRSDDEFYCLPDDRVIIYAADGFLADERCYHGQPTGAWCDVCGVDNTMPPA